MKLNETLEMSLNTKSYTQLHQKYWTIFGLKFGWAFICPGRSIENNFSFPTMTWVRINKTETARCAISYMKVQTSHIKAYTQKNLIYKMYIIYSWIFQRFLKSVNIYILVVHKLQNLSKNKYNPVNFRKHKYTSYRIAPLT